MATSRVELGGLVGYKQDTRDTVSKEVKGNSCSANYSNLSSLGELNIHGALSFYR